MAVIRRQGGARRMAAMAMGTSEGKYGAGGWGLLGLLHAWFTQLARPVPQDQAVRAFLADVAEMLAAPDAEVWVRGSHGGWRRMATLGDAPLLTPDVLQDAMSAAVGLPMDEQGPRLWLGCRCPGPGGEGSEDGRWLGAPLVTDRDLHGVMVFRRAVAQSPFPMELVPLVAVAARPLALVLDHQRLKDAFVATVSHELRTPLATLGGFVELMAARPMPYPEQQPLLQVMLAEAGRLGRLIEDLLDLTRMQAGTLPLRHRKCGARSLLHRALGPWLLHPDHADRLSWTVAPHCLQVRVDPDLFIRIVVNLVGNAYRHVPAPAPVSVRLMAVEDGWVLEVADGGPGMAPHVRQRVGDAFLQGGDAPPGGLGLGLALSRAMLDLHGATLSVEVPEHGGTVFRCRFPSSGTPSASGKRGGARGQRSRRVRGQADGTRP
ncbi:MAG: HAMP domain-containing sensor histidine kinase, partial [Candidatus Sericytochromatia bacterium]|nr:HAMP domain-containing sensor histidine kinase [Candidatus Sericytochromatia bacterium]